MAKLYRLKSGMKHSAFREGQRVVLKEGDTLALSKQAFKNFGDKFELVDSQVVANDDKPETESENDGNSEVVELELSHVGKGRYKVIYSDTEEPIHEGTLTRKQANKLLEES